MRTEQTGEVVDMRRKWGCQMAAQHQELGEMRRCATRHTSTKEPKLLLVFVKSLCCRQCSRMIAAM